ncbi:hypothetical protein [Streptococcus marmotae]|nr:hypothetical protein [Streptococcus marmotae]
MNRMQLVAKALFGLLLIGSMLFAIHLLTVDEGYLPLEVQGVNRMIEV